jgi:hypothetical protein
VLAGYIPNDYCCAEQKAYEWSLQRRSAIGGHFCAPCGVAQIVTCEKVPYGENGSCGSVYLLQLFCAAVVQYDKSLDHIS